MTSPMYIRYVPHISESILAVIITLLAFQPTGSLRLTGCGMQEIADWYESSSTTFGEWMEEHGYSAAGGSRKGHIMSMWLMAGQ